jgi:hypothetical protein
MMTGCQRCTESLIEVFLSTSNTLHRAADIRGMSTEDIVELAEREVGE